MLINDRIYGQAEITDPAIIELVECPTLLRLKDIDQAGYFEPYFPNTRHSRFEHSVGVCLLLKRFGASREEQIAGLIHDVSHSAFSHCIDYVLGEGAETQKAHNHGDDIFEAFVKNSSIPGILARHGIDIGYILDDAHFPLKEMPIPELCADRIDYSLRGAVVYGEKTPADIARILDRLTARDGRWVFADYAHAREFAEMFRTMSSVYYAGVETATMFITMRDYLRHAMERHYITKEDLYTTDTYVLKKIAAHHSSDPVLHRLFSRLNREIPVLEDRTGAGEVIYLKSRIVDPWCINEGKLLRVSEVDPSWREVVAKEMKPKKYCMQQHNILANRHIS